MRLKWLRCKPAPGPTFIPPISAIGSLGAGWVGAHFLASRCRNLNGRFDRFQRLLRSTLAVSSGSVFVVREIKVRDDRTFMSVTMQGLVSRGGDLL